MSVKQTGSDGGSLALLKQLWTLAHGLDSKSKQLALAIGITARERLVMRYISERPRSTPGIVAAELNMSPSKFGRILRRLEQRRLVARLKDRRDRRRVILVVTPRGRRLERERRGTIEGAVRRTLGRVDSQTKAMSGQLIALLVGDLLAE